MSAGPGALVFMGMATGQHARDHQISDSQLEDFLDEDDDEVSCCQTTMFQRADQI